MRVDDALGEAGGAGRVVELRGVVGRGVDDVEGRVAALEQLVVEDQHVLDQRRVDAVLVGLVRDQHLGLRVGDAVLDAVVAVEHRHRQQDRAGLVGAEERGRRLRRRRQQHRDAVAALDAVRPEHVGEAVGELLSSPHLTSRTLPSGSSWIIASLPASCLSQTSTAML